MTNRTVMKQLHILLIIVIISISSSSCTYYHKIFGPRKTPFTNTEREQLVAKQVPLNMIQYYNEKKIMLKRVLDSAGTIIKSGEVQLENGKYINYVTLEKETPGKCVSFTESTINISFEASDPKGLTFVKTDNNNAPYVLQVVDGNIEYQGEMYKLYVNTVTNIKNIGTNNKGYKTPVGNTALLIKKNTLYSKKIHKSVMKGNKVN